MTFNVHNDLEFDLNNDFEGHLKTEGKFFLNLPLFFMAKIIKYQIKNPS